MRRKDGKQTRWKHAEEEIVVGHVPYTKMYKANNLLLFIKIWFFLYFCKRERETWNLISVYIFCLNPRLFMRLPEKFAHSFPPFPLFLLIFMENKRKNACEWWKCAGMNRSVEEVNFFWRQSRWLFFRIFWYFFFHYPKIQKDSLLFHFY